jgi:hypothetical protein
MKFAVIKNDENGKKISSFIESFDKLRDHLKMIYPSVTFIQNMSLRALRKGAKFENDKKYILLNNPVAILAHKSEKPPGILPWSTPASQLTKLCSWELIILDVVETTLKETPRIVGNFDIKSFTKGSMCVVYKDYKECIDLVNKFSRILNEKLGGVGKKIIVSQNHGKFDMGDSTIDLCKYESYNMEIIESDISSAKKAFLIIDYKDDIDANNYNNTLKIINDAKKNGIVVLILVSSDDNFNNFTHATDHTMMFGGIASSSLKHVYEASKIKDVFTTHISFVSIFRQLTSKFGTMIISRGRDDQDMVSWYR